MSTFIENLWNSVFTPGTTPTLLIATNVTFGALQVVLGILLATTKSIHFIVLSTLCAGLWWAINWFAAELQKAEKAEQEAGRLRKRRTGLMEEKRENDRDTDYTGEDSTETETEVEGDQPKRVQVRGGPHKAQAVMDSAAGASDDASEHPRMRIRGGPQKILGVMESAKRAEASRQETARQDRSASSGIQIRGGPEKIAAVLGSAGQDSESQESARRSTGELGESGSVSTDSEWEKVSDR
ncbi:Pkr1-domain-containing protein [Microthyrium microscopicum]|uniref:Pkr1-domain-containing protein n=1 Tax=Microthyrium microscopicum TaxID=703497 RepID=A0A6A6TZP1_9PEZI|nr:Pkr1-domain-containing protein [Microthyrium microscopicum]